jgi:hypothetical protein
MYEPVLHSPWSKDPQRAFELPQPFPIAREPDSIVLPDFAQHPSSSLHPLRDLRSDSNSNNMSYYENNGPWPAQGQGSWDHQASTSSIRSAAAAGASGPQAQDDFAFSQQFEEVDRAVENISKSTKTYGMPGVGRREYAGSPAPGMVKHHSRMNTISGPAPRPHSMNAYDEMRSHGSHGLQNFYANQRHNSSRGSNEAEQVMLSKRRMAAQRERELRNHHMEQQYQRTLTTDTTNFGPKGLSEEQSRQLIARQRSALYRDGQFGGDKTGSGYVDETGALRHGLPGHSGPSSLRGQSPMTFDIVRAHPPADAPGSALDAAAAQISPVGAIGDGSRANSTASPQLHSGAAKAAFESVMAQATRTTASSPTDSSNHDSVPAAKGTQNPAVAPIGTRPNGSGTVTAAKRAATPLASPGGWTPPRSNLWGQSSGLSSQASVWG